MGIHSTISPKKSQKDIDNKNKEFMIAYALKGNGIKKKRTYKYLIGMNKGNKK